MANIKNVMEDEQALTLLNNGLVKVDKYKKVINKIIFGVVLRHLLAKV